MNKFIFLTNTNNNRLLYLLLFVFTFVPFLSAKSQVAVDKKGTFVFAGVTMNMFSKHNLASYYGYSPSDNFQALAVLPFFNINKNIQFMPGYMMVKSDENRILNNIEHHFLPSVIFNFKLSEKLILTDRNMYFRVERNDAEQISFYRNRIGLIYKTNVFNKSADIFIHDAMFWNLDNGKFTRNRVILGGNIELKKWIKPQIWYVLQNDTNGPTRHQFYLFLTVPLENFGTNRKK